MEYKIFAERLEVATKQALSIARKYVEDELPDALLYLICPNCGYTGKLVLDEETFPEDALLPGQIHRPPTDAMGVLDYLWRNGKIPGWINISVVKTDAAHTFLFLTCCGRFTTGDGFYHKTEGIPPFHVLSPGIPEGWKLWPAKTPQTGTQNSKPVMATMEEMLAINGKWRLENRYLERLQAWEDQRWLEK